MTTYRLLANHKDSDPIETAEWIASMDSVLKREGSGRVHYLLAAMSENAHRQGVALPFTATTPYINTIPPTGQPIYPGNLGLERRIKSIIRWNAMAMVVRANRDLHGIGGHISTFASAATLYEVGFNHFFRGPVGDFPGDMVFFQGHAAPGIYARAYLEGRLSLTQLNNFRRELAPGGGLASYPHPWLMPGFWQFATVSMGLGPLTAIYQARFNRYLEDRGLVALPGPGANQWRPKVWAFLGDGEMDEPESLGAITLPAREQLDNLIFVVNCNLQRLDGPVRGNGKIIQELEGIFRGAGWNVIKVIWGSDWDPLLASPAGAILARRMEEVVDGDYQKYVVSPGSYIREHFFGKYPELVELVKNIPDEKLKALRRGGHDPEKIYTAYRAAVEHTGSPTVILAQTIKGYGMGEAGEGRNITHQQKRLNEEELREFRARFAIPISDDDVAMAPFYKPPDHSPEMSYLQARREQMGPALPVRRERAGVLETPAIADYREFLEGTGQREVSTTMAFVRLLGRLLKEPAIGKRIVPIIPDESRTFGLESLFRQVGIYSHVGQVYQPVDSDTMLYYREIKEGQILEEGITEAGGMASFIAAGSSCATWGLHMIPVFMFYSMFGFQRIGDLIWAASDMRCRGFLVGGTSGRTTLNGEGLQHQDGHSHLMAAAYPTVRAYDPAFAYEIAVITLEGLRRMYHDQEYAMYYLTIGNENYPQPSMPEGAEEGICRGMYKLASREAGPLRVQLLGSGAILREAMRAQELLAERYGISSDLWSVTSYGQLRRDALETQRWNMLHPEGPARQSYLGGQIAGLDGPFIAASDYVRAVPQQIDEWIAGGLFALGTDGFGRSDSRQALRRYFEVDAEFIALAALYRLAQTGKLDGQKVRQAIGELGIDPDKADPLTT